MAVLFELGDVQRGTEDLFGLSISALCPGDQCLVKLVVDEGHIVQGVGPLVSYPGREAVCVRHCN